MGVALAIIATVVMVILSCSIITAGRADDLAEEQFRQEQLRKLDSKNANRKQG